MTSVAAGSCGCSGMFDSLALLQHLLGEGRGKGGKEGGRREEERAAAATSLTLHYSHILFFTLSVSTWQTFCTCISVTVFLYFNMAAETAEILACQFQKRKMAYFLDVAFKKTLLYGFSLMNPESSSSQEYGRQKEI